MLALDAIDQRHQLGDARGVGFEGRHRAASLELDEPVA
jgi:hypothetical protein